MKILRSTTRRGFNVGTAGWFTITSPGRWFPASRLPTGFQDFLDQPKRTAPRIDPPSPDQKVSDQAATPLQFLSPDARRSPLRLVLIALVAAVLTLAMLRWII